MPIIRPATAADTQVVADFNCRLASESEGKTLDTTLLAAGVRAALLDPLKCRYFLAEEDGTILGQVGLTYEWSDWRNGWIWWLQSVYVARPFRGRGIFRALYHQIRSEARALPDVIGLRLYVEDSKEPARRTYQALGMKPGGYSVYEDLWIPGLG